MEGILSIQPPKQRAHAGYALIEILGGLVATAVTALWRAGAAISRAQRMARVRREMEGLSDHYLRDIGLSRHEIERIFR